MSVPELPALGVTPDASRPGGALQAPARRAAHPLAGFVLRRLVTGLVTLFVASIVIFLATNALPGNVARAILGRNATPQSLASLREQLHLNRPLPTRYVEWLSGAVQGHLGKPASTITQGAGPTVAGLIGTPILNTLLLALVTVALLVPLALVLGTVAAVRAGRPSDYAISYTALVLGALPEFVLGTILVLIFFTRLHLLPPLVIASGDPFSRPTQLILPVLTLLGASLSFLVRQLRVGVIRAMKEDYVTMARLGGIAERRVRWRYGLRNAMAPTLQSFAQTVLYLFGGTVIVEALFSYPGIGRELVQAVSARDIVTVQGITLVLTASYIVINIAADLAVVLLVPRLRTGGGYER